MSRIKVDTDAYESIAMQLARLSDSIGSSTSQLAICQTRAALTMPRGTPSLALLNQTMRKLRSTARTASNLGRSVKRAGQVFEVCEKHLIANIRDIPEAIRQQGNIWNNCPILKTMDDILDSLGIDKFGRNYEDPGIEREKAVNEAIKLSLMQLLGERGFSEADWRRSTLKQRQDMLNHLLKRMMDIFGVKVKPNIRFFSEPCDSEGYITNGYYSDSQRLVAINTEVMNDDSYSRNIETLIHEMRHAYQHAAVRDPDSFIVSRNTIETWEHNFNNYKTSGKDGFQAYRDQPIERDARAAAEGVL